jgi:hypothetical protein
MLRANSWHQPLGLMSPWTNLHAFGGWKLMQPSQRWSPFGVPRYLASAWLIFCRAPACRTAVVAAAAPSASAVPVRTTRREMRWQSFLPLFMIDFPSGLMPSLLRCVSKSNFQWRPFNRCKAAVRATYSQCLKLTRLKRPDVIRRVRTPAIVSPETDTIHRAFGRKFMRDSTNRV